MSKNYFLLLGFKGSRTKEQVEYINAMRGLRKVVRQTRKTARRIKKSRK